MLPRRRHPLWFELIVAATLALVLRELAPLSPWGGAGGDAELTPLLAFWPLLATIASAIWKGLEIAGRVTLEALKWSVLQLWSFARSTYNGLVNVGKDLVRAARRAWDFFEATYERVLKPAWQRFWQWFDRARRWLEDVFRPVFRFLEFVRRWLLDFYAKYVRPILDTLAIAQKVLRVLERLGLDWARKLDAQLAELQRRIDAPFRLVLAEINKIINLIDRVVTVNGLIQRVALIRSIERDIREVSRAWWNTAYTPLTADERARVGDTSGFLTPEQHAAEFKLIMSGKAGERSAEVEEHAADLKLMLRRARRAA